MKRRIATELLEQWGIWVHQKTGVPRYVSPMLVVMRNNVPSTHAPDAQITDEDAEEVSAILARLKARYPQSYEAIELYYSKSMTHLQVGNKMGLHRLKARELVMNGECYVQAVLDVRDERFCAPMDRAAIA